MRLTRFLTVTVAAAALAAAVPASASAATSLFFGTHNMYVGKAQFTPFAGVLGFQEVNEPRDKMEMRFGLPGYDRFVPKGDAGDVPIAWLRKRFKLVDKDSIRTHKGEKLVTPSRYVNWVRLRVKRTGAEFFFVNTHFISKAWSGKPERRKRWKKHARVLRREVAKLRQTGLPVFVVGDFNRRGTALGIPGLTYVGAPAGPARPHVRDRGDRARPGARSCPRTARTTSPTASKSPSSGVALVLAAIASLQVGAAFAVTLFDDVGPAGASFLRLAIAAVVLLAWWRPRVRAHAREELATAVAFGLVLGDDELGHLLGHGPHPDRGRGDDRVRRAAGPRRRAVAACARPRVGGARRGRHPAAHEPVRRLRPGRRRRRVRAARGGGLGGLHPAVGAHRRASSRARAAWRSRWRWARC